MYSKEILYIVNKVPHILYELSYIEQKMSNIPNLEILIICFLRIHSYYKDIVFNLTSEIPNIIFKISKLLKIAYPN